MPFKFSDFCSLLDSLEKVELRDPPLLRTAKNEATRKIVRDWFRQHRRAIDAPDTNGAALLSSLFPEKRIDRVYGIQVTRLNKTIPRCLHLNAIKVKQLELWKQAGNGDLGACVERVLKEYDCEPKPESNTVEDIDRSLEELAARCDFSSPGVRAKRTQRCPDDILRPLYMKCKSNEAKWLTRLILKDFAPIVLEVSLIQSTYHFLLPFLLQFSDSFTVACANLRGPLKRYHANPDIQSQAIFRAEAANVLEPLVGVKVGRPPYHKARSMEQCLKWCARARWSVERKYDGEYCEIHIDMSKGPNNCIKTFSKKGKDSTTGLKKVHNTIRSSLRIGQPDCRFQSACIVVGELLVYDDNEQTIAPFHKIRKHVSRGERGVFLGTDADSLPYPHEQLMIVYHDILLLDSEPILNKTYGERRMWLREVIHQQLGRARTSERKVLDFSLPTAANSLMEHFAASLANRAEGLILKPVGLPYVSGGLPSLNTQFKGIMKLKKDYLQIMGEERDHADLAVIGASYDAQKSFKGGIKNMKYTDFYLGCLKNPDDVRFGRNPIYKVMGCLSAGESCIPPPDLETLNQLGQFREMPFSTAFDPSRAPFCIDIMEPSYPSMHVIFKEPFVAEVLGSGFEKPPNKSYFMLRHPRVLKLHEDRDCISFEDLQKMAEEVCSVPQIGEKEETKRLMEVMESRARRKKEREGSLAITPRDESLRKLVSPLGVTPNTISTTGSSSPQRRRGRDSPTSTPCPPVLIRKDTKKLLPGESRFVPLVSLPNRRLTRSATDLGASNGNAASPIPMASAPTLPARSVSDLGCRPSTDPSNNTTPIVITNRLELAKQRARKRLSEACAEQRPTKRRRLYEDGRTTASSPLRKVLERLSKGTSALIASSPLRDITNTALREKDEIEDSWGFRWTAIGESQN